MRWRPYVTLGMHTDQYNREAEIGVIGAIMEPILVMAYAGFLHASTLSFMYLTISHFESDNRVPTWSCPAVTLIDESPSDISKISTHFDVSSDHRRT